MPVTTLGDLICARAHDLKDRVALLGGDAPSLTYGRLRSRLDGWTDALARHGLGRTARIGVLVPAGPDLAVAILAVSSQAVCAPLDPNAPAPQVARDCADLGLDLLVTTKSRAMEFRALGLPVAWVDGDRISPVASRHNAGQESVRPGDTALLLRTSGTTGAPKLVSLSHAHLLSAAANVRESLALSGNDRCFNIMPLWHVHGFVAGVLASLTAGGSVVCVPAFSSVEFLSLVRRTNATWYTASPALHRAILASVAGRPVRRHRLRLVRSASAYLPSTVAKDLETTFGVPVIEAYGMTEAAHQITSNPVPPGRRKIGSVGIMTETHVTIRGLDGAPLAANEEGEIVIRGGNVFGGYEHDPASGSSFIQGWFRTGDIGRLDPDGYLFITGRIREMINRGGETISPRDIEDRLLDHPDVRDAVVFGVPHARLGETVAVAVVTCAGSRLTEVELRRFAAANLALSKVPARIMFTTEIPRSPTGKPQRTELRRRLATSSQVAVEQKSDRSAESTSIERDIAMAWAELLEVAEVGVSVSLTELGRDSLLNTRMVNRVMSTFGVCVPTVELFLTDTVREQAALVRSYLEDNSGPG